MFKFAVNQRDDESIPLFPGERRGGGCLLIYRETNTSNTQHQSMTNLSNVTDSEIVEALLAKDSGVTHQFLYVNCRPLFLAILNKVFDYPVELEEFVSELYVYLMEDDGRRLHQYEGRSSLYQWMKVVALRFAMRIKMRNAVIDNSSTESPYLQNVSDESASDTQAKADVENLLERMSNLTYVYVIRRHILEGVDERTLAEEMNMKVSNIYNLKRRAMAALTKIALNDVKNYAKKRY